MINLKRSVKEIKKEKTVGIDSGGYIEKYPWGTRLRFNEDLIDKVKSLQTIASGTEIIINAKAFICEVSTNETAPYPGKKGKKNVNVEIQITDIDIKDNMDAEASFNEK